LVTHHDAEQDLVQRLAMATGRRVRGGRALLTEQEGLPPEVTWARGQEPLPTCEYPTTDALGRDRYCRRIATHISVFPSLPFADRTYCGYHAIMAASQGEIFEPVDWLVELGQRNLASSSRS